MKEALTIEGLNAWYGESHILHGVDLKVYSGEVITILGRNGSGRTTTLRAIMGLMDKRTGSIKIEGKETVAMKTFQIARLGLGYCPEERAIFSSLSCEENLLLPPKLKNPIQAPMSLENIYQMFPNLLNRKSAPGTKLSGGEQQMLAMARILRTGAHILLLDEISEGLAPVIVQKLAETIRTLKQLGYTIIMVEQNFHFASDLADRFYVMEHGEVIEHFEASQLSSKKETLQQLLGV